jgi:hypothetical protein
MDLLCGPSPTGLRHAAQECRALARLSWEPRTTPDPRPFTNPNGVPSPERPHAHESPTDGTALRSDAEWGVVARESQGNLAEARHPWAAWRNRFAVRSWDWRRLLVFVFGIREWLRCGIPSPTGLRHAAPECRAPASALRGPRIRPMNPNGVPSSERPRHLAAPKKASRPIFASFSAPKLEISPQTPKTVAPGASPAPPGAPSATAGGSEASATRPRTNSSSGSIDAAAKSR